jgi:hypothetical protein
MGDQLAKHRDAITAALARALAAPGGLPLVAGRHAGLFAATASGKQAAAAALEQGLLQPVHSEVKGRTATPICVLSERGLEFLKAQAADPAVLRQVLVAVEACGRELSRLGQAVTELGQTFAQMHSLLASLTQTENAVSSPHGDRNGQAHLQRDSHTGTSVQPGAVPWEQAVAAELERWQQERGGTDCPLPVLWHRAQQVDATVTLGKFHDLIRRWQQSHWVHVHPWTGPLHELPDPGIALLVGHAVIYYVSRR